MAPDFDHFHYADRRDLHREDAVLELDGQRFIECSFERCTLVFRGEQPFSYTKTEFIGCLFLLEGRAKMVLDVVARMFPAFTDPAQLPLILAQLASGQGIVFN